MRGAPKDARMSMAGCLGITSKHRVIAIIHSGAARRRWRRIVDPVHAAFIKGLGDSNNNVNANNKNHEGDNDNYNNNNDDDNTNFNKNDDDYNLSSILHHTSKCECGV